MAAQNGAVDWDAPARVDEDRVAHAQLARIDLAHAPGATHEDRAREKVHQVEDRAAPARNGHAFQHLGHQDEQRNDEGGEELADRRSRNDRDGH